MTEKQRTLFLKMKEAIIQLNQEEVDDAHEIMIDLIDEDAIETINEVARIVDEEGNQP